MLSYFWPSEETISPDYTSISQDQKDTLSQNLVGKISEYFTSVQTKGLLVTISAAITLLGANKLRGLGVAPSISAGLGVGTPSALTVSGTDVSGVVAVTTGTAAASNILATVTFTSPYTTAPVVVFSPANETTGTHISRVHVESSTTGFSLVCSSVALSDTTAYRWNYHVIQ